jgi:hypothetical protein
MARREGTLGQVARTGIGAARGLSTELCTKVQLVVPVHDKNADGCPAGWSETDDPVFVHDEVIGSPLQARIEQRDDLGRNRVDTRKVGALVPVAMVACESQVGKVVAAAVLPGNHVLDMEGEKRVRLLWQTAVLAVFSRPLMDRLTRACVDHEGCCARSFRALAWSTEMKRLVRRKRSYS